MQMRNLRLLVTPSLIVVVMAWAAGFKDLLDHFMKLVHLDGIDTDVDVLVFGFFNCSAECVIQFADSRP